jgi:NADH-quinone oxidoreductase subunit L
MLQSIWIVPFCPLLGAALNCFFGRRYSKAVVGQVAIAAMLVSFIAALVMTGILISLGDSKAHVQITLFEWIASGAYHAPVGFLIDGLSCTMMLVVTGVGLLIHIYSTGYMHDEVDYSRYFTYLNLFAGTMLILVLADNYLLMFVGWEGVGLCSYLLIGFWYTRKSASDAGKKAFIVNRIGDFGFMLAMLLLFVTLKTTDMLQVEDALVHNQVSVGVMTAMALLLFVGAVGKSAQVPLYVWLPDAMEGPTPVSALIHAATMVTAGVYMIARSSVLYTLAPVAAGIVAFIGVLTALFAATMALTATDIKRVLAYSTVSQLGYMVLAAGIGAYVAAVFHLVTHAFFKALLFLGAGSVIHGLHDEQDMREMGGLRTLMPTTHWTMFVATLAIAGIFPLAGFWSKDEILAGAIRSGGINILWWVIALVTAFMTSFYMFRLYYMTFYGEPRMPDEVVAHVHESPPSMGVPLILLAVLSIIGGFLGVPPEGGMLHHILEPVFHKAVELSGVHHAFALVDVVLMALSLAVAIAGWWMAYRFYVQSPQLPEQWAERWKGYYNLLVNKYYVDEGYAAVCIKPIYALSQVLWRWVDDFVIDGIVNLVGKIVEFIGEGVRWFQTGNVRTYAVVLVAGTLYVLWQLIG